MTKFETNLLQYTKKRTYILEVIMAGTGAGTGKNSGQNERVFGP